MKIIKSHFVLNREQRSGILLLVLLICVCLAVTYFRDFSQKIPENDPKMAVFQAKIDSIKALKTADTIPKIYPFNPNFISDYKGYVLGLSLKQIDKLHQFRETDQWINSTADFKKVTGVSDSLLAVISPYFKFPDWVVNAQAKKPFTGNKKKSTAQKNDINTASVEDLLLVKELNEELAIRIVNYRKRLGGFLEDNQLFDVYGLPSAVVFKIKDEFTVQTRPEITPINVNEANASDLSTISFITFDIAREIINYRELHEGINDLDELLKIEGINAYKLERIKLYLSSSQK
ncbi:ComEA family DNA-binding protein [Flavimarina sp. Hel_I_48]|uniref:ComEA family DNA-binding protein n=1 Tax=Flavimarina sp. Hel_I_48 TaxID=1392488 RepID=UPI0004DEDEAD|nr:helix-hairpin-helix domain-containing protein [Flavimarina sp. Hel_I_48]